MDSSNNISGTGSVPSRPRKRSINTYESSSANARRNNSVVEILSDDEPEIIDLDHEPEVDNSLISSGDVEIVGINTDNPTPITRNAATSSLFVRDDDGEEGANQDDIEITNVRHIENNDRHNHHTVHTPFGHFQIFMPNAGRAQQQQQQREPASSSNRTLYRLAHPSPQQLRLAQLARNNQRHRAQSRQRQRRSPMELFAYIPFRQPIHDEEDGLDEFLRNMLDSYGEGDFESNAVEESILQRIENDNERELNHRLQQQTMFNMKALEEKKRIAESSKEITSHTSTIKADMNLVCELCGTVLGEGIPEDFSGDPEYNENFEKFTNQYQVQAPWFCTYPMTQVDKELSKRIFVAKCGHTFCGRCVKNIGNRPRRTKATRSGLTILNPSIFAPFKCPESKCNKKFSGKSFTEIYF
ncbi:E3 ubiquitin-protein ligase complex SLX5-SLX8 subunit SLX5 [Spathaspora sp. JA1]|nr:E3 ubiquitin-protein ligase complex SLX5-SLX8 subunit SLX5 [Spathaspora sp. JA1]